MFTAAALACIAILALTSAEPVHVHPVDLVRVHDVTHAFVSDALLQASPTSLGNLRSGWVRVSWSGIPNPTDDDWIGAYLEGEDMSQIAPIKYQFVRVATNDTLSFRLINFRVAVVFAYMQGGTNAPVVICVSGPVTFDNYNAPAAGRLALTGNPSEMMIQWTTRDIGKPYVRYGAESTDLTEIALGTSYTYSKEDMCGSPANDTGYRSPGTFNKALMTGLSQGQRYFYQFGDDKWGFSNVYSFIASPALDTDVTIFAFGDLGQYEQDDSLQPSEMPPSLDTTRAMKSDAHGKSLLLHIGDLSYARGYVSIWDIFHDQIQALSVRMPYMTAIGNHERNWPGSGGQFNDTNTDSGGECGVAAELRFLTPSPELDSPWYSFNWGPVHFLVMSTEHEWNNASEQYAFFEADLAAVDRSVTPWVVFSGHRPFYIDSSYDSTPDSDQFVAEDMRATFEDLLYEYRVDVIWGAHHHSYQRSCPVYKNECVSVSDGEFGFVVVDIGMAGAGNSQNLEDDDSKALWEVVDDSHHGYTEVRANRTHFTQVYKRGFPAQVFDEFTLAK